MGGWNESENELDKVRFRQHLILQLLLVVAVFIWQARNGCYGNGFINVEEKPKILKSFGQGGLRVIRNSCNGQDHGQRLWRIIRERFSLPYLMPQSQGFHFSFGSVSLMIMISLFYRVFSLSVIDSELHGDINLLES